MKMSKETVGAFADAVYAIAVTILALVFEKQLASVIFRSKP